MSHYEERLGRDLDEIRSRVAEQSDWVRGAIADALKSLIANDRDLAYRTVLRDARINESMRNIDALCHRFIARHLPSAGHLRLMSSVMRTSLQLERIGDYAVTIAREGIQLSTPPSGPIAYQLELTIDNAKRMLARSLEAFHATDEAMARATMDMGKSIEDIMDHIYADLLEASEAARVKDLLALFVVFSLLKRVTDLAKNICEETLFVATGEAKAGRVYDVLFVDDDNALASQMACAIGARNYPGLARFSSAGLRPAERVDPGLEQFLDEHGYDTARLRTRPIDAADIRISDFFVVVSLDGPISRYVDPVPFHTSVLEWDIPVAPGSSSSDAVAEYYARLHRELAVQVGELVEMLAGRAVA